MNCPHCGAEYRVALVNGSRSELLPCVCERCGELAIAVEGQAPRPVTDMELESLQDSRAWTYIVTAQQLIWLRNSRMAVVH